MTDSRINKSVGKKKPKTMDSNRLNKIQYAMLDSLSEFDKMDEHVEPVFEKYGDGE